MFCETVKHLSWSGSDAVIWLTVFCLTASPAQDWLARCFGAVLEGSYSKSPSLFCVGMFGRGRSSPVSSRDSRTTSSVFTVISKSKDEFLNIRNLKSSVLYWCGFPFPAGNIYSYVYFNPKGISYLILSSRTKWLLYTQESSLSLLSLPLTSRGADIKGLRMTNLHQSL